MDDAAVDDSKGPPDLPEPWLRPYFSTEVSLKYPKLHEAAVGAALEGLPGWSRRGDELVKTFRFDRYLDGIAFVDALAARAEAADHHPDLGVHWGRVEVRLTTHDAGGITEQDVDLARQIESLG
jgi:4a-hydroxytetrahydrobiopterin dehydratase